MNKIKYLVLTLIAFLVGIWLAYMPLLTAYTHYQNEKRLAEIKQFDAASYTVFKAFIEDVEAKTAWRVLIVSGYRNEKSQAILKKINPKNAKAGQSKHNFGKAIDMSVFKSSNFGVTWLSKSSSKKAWENSQITAVAQINAVVKPCDKLILGQLNLGINEPKLKILFNRSPFPSISFLKIGQRTNHYDVQNVQILRGQKRAHQIFAVEKTRHCSEKKIISNGF